MHENLSESEIEFMEFYSDPVALIENLIPENFNVPQSWPDCKCLILRDYQFPMLNYSYMYAYDPLLSELKNRKIQKGAGDLYSIGARNLGKCENALNVCQLADGSLKKFGELINTKQDVLSFNDKTLKIEKDIATFIDNGLKPCYKIITDSGKEITITENHPLYTDSGWIVAKNLKEKQYIATPRKIEINGKDVDDNLAKILGYLIGDGSCTHHVGITNINKELISEIYELADYFDCRVYKNQLSYYFAKKEIPKIFRGQNKKNNIKKLVLKYKINCLSKNKIIHPEIFTWSNKSLALLLNRLYSCDGHISQDKSGYISVEICLASKKLIYQIQTLLLRFGIHSDIYYKKAKCNGKYFDAWRLNVGHDANIFLDKIGVKSKDNVVIFKSSYSTSDRIPNSFILKYYDEFKDKKKYKLRHLKSYNPSRLKCQKIAKKINHKELNKLANSDIYWEKIKSIKFIGLLSTVMVSVKKNHTYISNNIVSHNSLILWIDSILTIIKRTKEACVASFDDLHLKKVTNVIANFIESHKFTKIFKLVDSRKKTVTRSPFEVTTQHGTVMKGVNENVNSDNPGVAFHSLHFDYLNFEEFSYSSDAGFKKRIDSGNSLGYIERLSGIPDLCIGSPLGKILQDKKKKNWIWQLPQYCVAEGSKILMTDYSTKKIEECNIGDKILTITENAPFYITESIIENKIYTGIKDTVCLSNGNNNIELTPDHKLFSKIDKYCKKWKSWNEFKDEYLTYSIPNYVEDYKRYYEGMFLGLLECEGSFSMRGNKSFYSIGQKSEKDTLEFLLNYLNIEYTKYFDNKDKEFAYFYLKISGREYIKYLYDSLELSKDRLLGFVVGFVIEDGCVHFNAKTNHRDLVIVQKNKCKILEKALNFLDIRYSKCKHDNNECFKYCISYLDLPIYAPFSKKGLIYQKMINGQSLLPFRRTNIYKTNNNKSKVWDLTTSSGTFIANGFVVHNCRQDWTSEIEEELAEKHGGKSSPSYKLNVEAITLEGAYGFWDMPRLRENCLNKRRQIKRFEVSKDTFSNFKNLIHVNRVSGTEQCFVCADIGFGSAPSEVIILFYDGKKYRYEYNITLRRLLQEEQAEIFRYLYNVLGGAFIGIDATSDEGAMFGHLKDIPLDHLLKVKFNANIEVDYERDAETGEILVDKNNNPIFHSVNTREWAFQELPKLFYNGLMEIPLDDVFLNQFTNMMGFQTKAKKIIYDVKTGENHLHSAFEVFAICRFINEFKSMKNINQVRRSFFSFGTEEKI